MKLQTHFHILWSSTPVLDWKVFQAKEEAESFAKTVLLKHETYAIVERNGDCERCVRGLVVTKP